MGSAIVGDWDHARRHHRKLNMAEDSGLPVWEKERRIVSIVPNSYLNDLDPLQNNNLSETDENGDYFIGAVGVEKNKQGKVTKINFGLMDKDEVISLCMMLLETWSRVEIKLD